MIDIKFTNLSAVLTQYAIDVRNAYQDRLIKHDRIASGRLLNSVSYHTVFGDNEYEVFLSLEDYWKYVEEDTKPHFPPKDVILNWIRIKPIMPRPYNGKLPTPEELAFLIGRAMAGLSPKQANCKNPQGGTTGTHDLQSALDEINARYETLIMEALDKDLAFAIDAEIKMLVKPFSDSHPEI